MGLSRPEFLFDDTLAAALKSLQQRHKLSENGELDQATLAWLNVPPYQMAQKIALNMKRWRHLPRELGDRLQLMNGGSAELDMNTSSKSYNQEGFKKRLP